MASDCEDTVEAENALEPTLHKLWKQIDRLASRIAVNLETEDRPVISGEAAAAVARAALALAPKTPSGDLRPGDDAEWLAYVVSEWAADQGATTTTLH
jgi:hypothetical protein